MLFSRSEGAEFKLNRGTKKSIAANPLFVPAMVLWGAALGGLAVFVLPESMIRSITETSGLGVLGGMARLFFSGLAAALGAAILYFVAKGIRRSGSGSASTLVNKAKKRVRPIDPSADLGSDSLDAPLELDEFAEDEAVAEDALDLTEDEFFAEPDILEFADDETLELSEEDCVADSGEEVGFELDDEIEAINDSAWVEELAQEIPDEERELTLGEWCEPYADEEEEEPVQKAKSRAARAFSRAKQTEEEPIELVKVFKGERAKHAAEAKPIATEICDASDEPHDEPSEVAQEPTSAEVEPKELPTGSAADLLRNTPADDLSLVQMVERLALALNDHREARISAAAARSTAKRDAALAEALRALTKFTEQGLEPAKPHNANEPDGAGREAGQLEMEEALAKLQSLRGAA